MTISNRPPSGTGRECVFDIETDGLLDTVSKVHCIVALDTSTKEVFDWRPWEVELGVRFLSECRALVGHNILGFDLLVLERFYPDLFKRPSEIWDTLVISRAVFPGDILIGPDMGLFKQGRLPGNLIKAYSLKAWGYRLGRFKGDFAGPWEVWTQDMHDYMIQDGHVNDALWTKLLRHLGWRDPLPGAYVWPRQSIDLVEQGTAEVIGEQERTGFYFDKPKAIELDRKLKNAQAALERELADIFGEWWAALDDPEIGKFPKRDMKRKRKDLGEGVLEHYSTEWPFVRIKRVTFSPSSRAHLGERLQKLYGWRPKKFGKNGKPTIDEDTLADIPPEVLPGDVREKLQHYFIVSKTLGMLSVGKNSWLNLVAEDGRLHGRMNTGGAITGRATHFKPNMSTVPAVQLDGDDKPILGLEGRFGVECRSLFTVPADKELTGVDISRLELALMGHYLEPFDGGRYAEKVSDPDVDMHQETGDDIGVNRRNAKTVTYCVIFGGGAPKAGKTVGVESEEIPSLIEDKRLAGLLAWRKRVDGKDYIEPDDREKAQLVKGSVLINKFFKGIPGMKDLKEGAISLGRTRRWLKGLDGRKLFVRKPHAALNTLLQGGGAIVCKAWLGALNRLIQQSELKGRCHQVAWSHDELQFEHEAGLGPRLAELSQQALDEVCSLLKLKVRLFCGAKTGKTWAETH